MKDNWGILIIIGAILGLYLLTKKSDNSGVSSYVNPISELPPIRLHPQKSYDNEEVREIEYNADGLPTRITIHRHARAA